MIYRITSKDNKNIKLVTSLYDSKTRNEMGLFVIEGFHLLEMALEAKAVVSVYTTKELKLPNDVEQFLIDYPLLKKMSKSVSPQGVIAICKTLPINQIEGNAIYLDEVSDPGNLGTILRTALAFGYHNVILGKGCVSLYNEKVISSSQGSIFKLNIVPDVDTLKTLKNKGYTIYSTALQNSEDITKIEKKSPFVLVFGNEARGVSEDIIKLSDKCLKIPMDEIDSLNVAVAAGISMFLLK